MEPTNWFSPSPTDHIERLPKMDPLTWQLKVLIVRIELQQKDPMVFLRALPPGHLDLEVWLEIRSELMEDCGSHGDRVALACDIAALDAWAIFDVLRRVEKDDNLLKVFVRALQSISEALRQLGCPYPLIDFSSNLRSIKKDFLALAPSEPRSKEEDVDASQSDSELATAYTLHAFLTSVLHLLTSVFQYLIGYVDRGGSKTYSSGAFDFRASFVALVLFQGAYVWIKFRQAARPDCRKRKAPDVVDIEACNLRGLHKRSIKNASGDFVRYKYEPRFKPPRQNGDDSTHGCSKLLPLGEYYTPAEAQIVLQTARYYYHDKDGGRVELKDGPCKFPIPPMSEQERGLAGEAKRKWVTSTAKQVGKQMYADFQREKGERLAMATEAGPHGAEFSDPSSSALPLACSSLPVPPATAFERVIASAAPSSPSPPLPPFDGTVMGDANDSREALSGDEDMIAGMITELLFDPGLPNLPDQQTSLVHYQRHYREFAQLLADPGIPDIGAVSRGTEPDSEPENLTADLSFQQEKDLANAGAENIDESAFLSQSVPDLQQLVLCQKKCAEDNARQFLDLDDHQHRACCIEISKLQLEKEEMRQEIESLKSKLQQVVQSQVATWTGIMIEMQQRD